MTAALVPAVEGLRQRRLFPPCCATAAQLQFARPCQSHCCNERMSVGNQISPG